MKLQSKKDRRKEGKYLSSKIYGILEKMENIMKDIVKMFLEHIEKKEQLLKILPASIWEPKNKLFWCLLLNTIILMIVIKTFQSYNNKNKVDIYNYIYKSYFLS